MAFTHKLGTLDSQLGNIQLGSESIFTGSVIDQSVGNTLTLTQDLDTNQVLGGVASVFAPTQQVSVNKVLNISVGNTVSLSQQQTNTSSAKNVNQTISFSQTLVGGFSYHKFISQTLSLNQFVDVQRSIPISSTLVFTSSATAAKTTGTYSTFAMTQDVGIEGTYNKHALQALVFTQTLVGNVTRALSLSQALTFTNQAVASRVRFFTLTNTFFPHHSVIHIHTQNLFSTFTMTQSVAFNQVFNRSITQTLALADTMVRNVVYSRGLSSIFNPIQGRFQSVNIQGQPGIKIITIPPVQITKVEKFVSYAVPGHILYLKPPEWGDSEGGLGKIIEHRTVTGKLLHARA